MRLAPLLDTVRRDVGYRALRDCLGAPDRVRFSVLEAAKPALIAALHGEVRRPLLLVVSRLARARQLAEELAAWSEQPEVVFLFPELDALPYERMVPGAEQLCQRMQAMLALVQPQGVSAPLVVATTRAVLDRLMPPEACRAAAWRLSLGEAVRLEQLLAEWERAGYEPVPVVAGPGEFARRGGIIDICPFSLQAAAFRIELEGNTVESIRTFDLATQRSSDLLSEVLIGPPHEVPPRLPPGADEGLHRLLGSAMRSGVREKVLEEIRLLSEERAFPLLECYRGLVASSSIVDYLPAGGLLVLDDPGALGAMARELQRQAEELYRDLLDRGEAPGGLPPPYLAWEELEERWSRGDLRRLDLVLDPEALDAAFLPAPSYSGRLSALLDAVEERFRVSRSELRGAEPQAPTRSSEIGTSVVIVSLQAARLQELLEEGGVAVQAGEELPRGGEGEGPAVVLLQGALGEGWENPAIGLTVLTDRELFGWAKVRRGERGRGPISREPFVSDLQKGELVVHVDHGIGRYRGLVYLQDPAIAAEREYLDIEYADRARLRVPVEHAERVTRYVGAGEALPNLTRLGSGDWQRTKRRIRSAVHRIARELIELYARRELAQGTPVGSDTPWQMELEASFPYVETPDQLEAVCDVKADMERSRPMDRLIVGDVGYGKTEVALRAAFKAVCEEKQVAVLVPTTVLAQQHYSTFRERLAPFPVRVEVLSRFLTDRQAREVLEGIRTGRVDIVIGTHRLLQPDVAFKDLGLLIIDEEQRFGVFHKERFKQLRTEVHVLTLSATPIPRTLHLSLVGVRDLSMMQTAPEERLPIRTYVTEYDESLVREAILRELDRGGQVYYVANRVYSIHHVAARLSALAPEVRIGIAHGQMPDEDLELTMLNFVNGDIDVLVCTTIIEAGLDLPNVNTLIVTDAHLFGLAQLYQLRGRVGRGVNRAYAYFLYPKDRSLSEVAEKRLRTIFEASELGAGYRIALKDLEIRGAGNLLGVEQHGHISAVGFDLYCRLLAGAVEQLRTLHRLALELQGEAERVLSGALPEERAASVALPVPAFLPSDYVVGEPLRLNLYQRLSAVRDQAALNELLSEVWDRFGALPKPAENLFELLSLRLAAMAQGIEEIAMEEGEMVIRFRQARRVDASALGQGLGLAVRGLANQVRVSLRPDSDPLSIARRVAERLGEQQEAPLAAAARPESLPC